MVDLVDVVLAGALGAALLAVALLYTGYRRNRALIAELRAELHSYALNGTSAEPDEAPPGRSRRARRDTGRLRQAARRLLPRQLRPQPVEPTERAEPAEPAEPAPATTGTVGVRDKEDLTKEPYVTCPIPPAPAPADDSEAPCDSTKRRRRAGAGVAAGEPSHAAP